MHWKPLCMSFAGFCLPTCAIHLNAFQPQMTPFSFSVDPAQQQQDDWQLQMRVFYPQMPQPPLNLTPRSSNTFQFPMPSFPFQSGNGIRPVLRQGSRTICELPWNAQLDQFKEAWFFIIESLLGGNPFGDINKEARVAERIWCETDHRANLVMLVNGTLGQIARGENLRSGCAATVVKMIKLYLE